jgi:N-acetylglucosamine-6-phosphate deacetylase
VNPSYKGMQNEEFILSPDENVLRDLLSHGDGHVKRVSLAPELEGAHGLIRLLREHGVYVSIAHTAATYEQALQAVRLGATHVTHCFNAMTALHHRRPGVAGAAMLTDGLYTELIADGVHIHPAVMRLLIRVKGRDRVMLVTDSMSAADMPDGLYRFGGHEVTVHDGVARMSDGTLASSTLTMDAAVRNLVRLCDVPLTDAVAMGSTTPAAAMGLGARKGKLVAGFDADLAVFDAALQPIATWIGGEAL